MGNTPPSSSADYQYNNNNKDDEEKEEKELHHLKTKKTMGVVQEGRKKKSIILKSRGDEDDIDNDTAENSYCSSSSSKSNSNDNENEDDAKGNMKTKKGGRTVIVLKDEDDEDKEKKEEEQKQNENEEDTNNNKDKDNYWFEPPIVVRPPKGAQHGRGGVFYGGNWVDIEDCAGTFNPPNSEEGTTTSVSGCSNNCQSSSCPRSMSRNAANNYNNTTKQKFICDVVIIGAGCIGGAVARELSKYKLKILWLEAADDVSQGATKGNSGIVHAGYDDKPGTNRAKYCWLGNQMFAQLDKQLRFGYQRNGSLVVAFTSNDMDHLIKLKKRGDINGVQNLRIIHEEELHKLEPYINPNAIGALYSSEAGNVIPYEYAIALAENAVDNGVELRIRREVQAIESTTTTSNNNNSNNNKKDSSLSGDDDNDNNDEIWKLKVRHWEPEEYVKNQKKRNFNTYAAIPPLAVFVFALIVLIWLLFFTSTTNYDDETSTTTTTMTMDLNMKVAIATILGILLGSSAVIVSTTQLFVPLLGTKTNEEIKKLVEMAGKAIGIGGIPVNVNDMLVGGSGACRIQRGVTVETETIYAKYIVNCAGGASDQISSMIGDKSFKIKPRIGDYILLNRNQGHLAKHTLFPCPDPKLGKGVLVQTTLWSNLILGPTARDMHDETAKGMTRKDIQEYILSKCKFLVPSFNPKETIHTFCGARAKSDRGDWIIEPSNVNRRMIHVAGIDSPGLAGSPAIAVEVVRLLQSVGLDTPLNPSFNPNRAPIITPKSTGMKGLKIGPVGKNDSDGKDETKMATNVICKCERVTELEVVRALRRSLPIDSTQAIRKRTRAGMGHCQGNVDNYNCEARVKAIIARETGAPIDHIGGRPWPATSILTQRWIDEKEKEELSQRMMG